MPRHDRLLALSSYRLAVRWANLTSAERVLQAKPEQRASIRHCYAEIRQLVMAANPDVMRALFLPPEPLDWEVAILSSEDGVRLLSVSRGTPGHTTSLLSIRFRVDDDGQSEREAWAALVKVLG